MKSYDSILVAEYMLSIAQRQHINLNVTKVQKLLYIIYGYFLAKFDHQIITENPKAWPFGPVFPRSQKKVDYSNIIPIENPKFNEIKGDVLLTQMITKIISDYSSVSAQRLVQWSHQEGSPWHQAICNGQKWNTPIDNESIKAYFQSFSL
jgi:uncharacterized phage-associated protein